MPWQRAVTEVVADVEAEVVSIATGNGQLIETCRWTGSGSGQRARQILSAAVLVVALMMPPMAWYDPIPPPSAPTATVMAPKTMLALEMGSPRSDRSFQSKITGQINTMLVRPAGRRQW